MQPAPESERVDRRRAAAVMVALLAFAHAPLWTGRVVGSRDVEFALAPMRYVVHRALMRTSLPRWNPWIGVGTPVPANPLYGTFYPLNWPGFLTDSAWVASATSFAHGVVGAFGAARLAAAFGVSPWSAIIAGLAWAIAGPTQSEWTAGARLAGWAWIPWAAVFAVGLLRKVRDGDRAPWGSALGLGLSLGLALLNGEVFIAMFAGAFALAAAIVEARVEGAPPWQKRSLRSLAMFTAISGALAALIGAPSLLPAVMASGGTQRASALSGAAATHWSLHPLRTLDFTVVGGWSVANAAAHDALTERVVGQWPLLQSYYLGATVLALALAGLSRQRRPVGVALIAAGGLALAFGAYTPAYAVARWIVPPLRFMRSPEKLLCVVVPAVAVLAAMGLDRLRAERNLTRPLALAAALLALAAFAPGIPDNLSLFFRLGAVQALVPVALLLAALAARRRLPRAAPILIACVVTLDLAHAALLATPWRDASDDRWKPPLVDTLARFAPTRTPGPVRIWRSDAIDDSLDALTGVDRTRRLRATLRANTNVRYEVGQLPGYDVALSPELDPLVARRRVDVARLLSVDAVLQPLRRPDAPPPRGLTPIGLVHDGAQLYAVESSLPRVYPAGASTELTDVTARVRALDPSVVSGREVLLSAAVDGATSGDRSPAGSCSLTGVSDGSLEARCALDRGAWVVFVEQWAPGWEATVDGARAPLRRANLLLLATRAPAGAHRISLRYTPPGLTLGLSLGALGVALASVMALLRRRARAVAT